MIELVKSTGPARSSRTQSERVAESTRRLASAAIELIAEQGFERTSAGAIGVRAGYSRSFISVRYGSKEDFIDFLFKEHMVPNLIPSSVADEDGLSRLCRFVDQTADLHRDDAEISRAFYTLAFEVIGPVVGLRAWYGDWIVQYTDSVLAAFVMGQRDGSIRADLDPYDEADQFMCHGIGIAFRWLLDPDRYDFEQAVERWRQRVPRIYAA
jgi:AcrR family transcriptional regulator